MSTAKPRTHLDKDDLDNLPLSSPFRKLAEGPGDLRRPRCEVKTPRLGQRA